MTSPRGFPDKENVPGSVRVLPRKPAYLQAFFLARWRDPDLNRGHHDFQSCALPTELSRHAMRSRSRSPVHRAAILAEHQAHFKDSRFGRHLRPFQRGPR
jgi:hypothetical protein